MEPGLTPGFKIGGGTRSTWFGVDTTWACGMAWQPGELTADMFKDFISDPLSALDTVGLSLSVNVTGVAVDTDIMSVINSRYIVGAQLGTGNYGTVCKAIDTNNSGLIDFDVSTQSML